MRKVITFTPEQWAHFIAQKKESLQTSSSAFIVQMLNERQKRPTGRPRVTDRVEDDANEDDVPMYKVPDKFTTSPYSYNDLVGWYEMHPEAGTMPDRKNLTIHKDYKKP